MSSLPNKSSTLAKEKLEPSEKVTPSEEVKKVTNILNDMENSVHTIHGKYLDNFQGQSTGSTNCLNLDHEWLKSKFSILETDFYKNFLEIILKFNISKHIKPL